MTSEMLTVLWIAAVGASLLFIALGGLVGLMYLLTAPWPPRRRGRAHPGRHVPVITAGLGSQGEERDRRWRAAAIAVAIACAQTESTDSLAADLPSDWRLIHRARRLGQSRVRRKSGP